MEMRSVDRESFDDTPPIAPDKDVEIPRRSLSTDNRPESVGGVSTTNTSARGPSVSSAPSTTVSRTTRTTRTSHTLPSSTARAASSTQGSDGANPGPSKHTETRHNDSLALPRDRKSVPSRDQQSVSYYLTSVSESVGASAARAARPSPGSRHLDAPSASNEGTGVTASPRSHRSSHRTGLAEELELVRLAARPKTFLFSRTFLGRLANQVIDREVNIRSSEFKAWRDRNMFRFARAYFACIAVAITAAAVYSAAAHSSSRHSVWLKVIICGALLPSCGLVLLSGLSPGMFLRVWEWGALTLMVSTEIGVSIRLIQSESCNASGGGTCHLAATGGVLVYFIPIVFGLSLVRSCTGMGACWALFTASMAASNWSDRADQVGYIVLSFVLFVTLISVHAREHDLFVVHFAFSRKMEEARAETQRAMSVIIAMKDRRHDAEEHAADHRQKLSQFRVLELKEHLHFVQETLRLATSHHAEAQVRHKAWQSLMAWMEPALRKQRRMTVSVVRSAGVHEKYDSGRTGVSGGALPTTATADSDKTNAALFSEPGSSDAKRHGSFVSERAYDREKSYTIAAVQNIQAWFSRMQTVHIGRHLLSSGSGGGDSKWKYNQVFLGGSCNPTTWRRDVAIPELRKAGITFYNPQVEEWSPDLIEVEAQAKAASKCLFFVIDAQTRAVSSVLESVEYICSGRVIILVISHIKDNTLIQGQAVTGRELKDINRGRAYLADVAHRHGVPVFETVLEGIQFITSQYAHATTSLQTDSALRSLSHSVETKAHSAPTLFATAAGRRKRAAWADMTSRAGTIATPNRLKALSSQHLHPFHRAQRLHGWTPGGGRKTEVDGAAMNTPSLKQMSGTDNVQYSPVATGTAPRDASPEGASVPGSRTHELVKAASQTSFSAISANESKVTAGTDPDVVSTPLDDHISSPRSRPPSGAIACRAQYTPAASLGPDVKQKRGVRAFDMGSASGSMRGVGGHSQIQTSRGGSSTPLGVSQALSILERHESGASSAVDSERVTRDSYAALTEATSVGDLFINTRAGPSQTRQ